MALTAKQWLPILFLVFLTCCTVNLSGPITSQGVLRLVCQELGKSVDCDDKEATQTVASWNMTVSIISGCFMFFSIGVWTSCAHKIGRKLTLTIAMFGIGTLDLCWGLVFSIPSLQAQWRYLIVPALAFNCCTGTVAVIYLGTFGSLNDLTHHDKATRSWLFALTEAIVGCTAIISSKVSGYMVQYPLYITMFTATGLFWTAALLTLLFLPNTIPKREQARKVFWHEMTLLTALFICIPTRRNVEKLQRGGTKKSNSSSHEYDQNDGDSDAEWDDYEESALTTQTPSSPLLTEAAVDPVESNQLAINSTTTPSSPNSPNHRHSIESVGDNYGLENPITEDQRQRLISDAKQKEEERDLTPPTLLPMLAVAFFATMFVLYGRKTITFMYFKTEYKIDATDYSNILSLDALGNAIAVIFILPWVKRVFLAIGSNLTVEIWASFLSLFIQGSIYITLPLLPHFINAGGGVHNEKIWVSYVLLFFCGVFSSVPSGVLRTALINATKSRHQQHRMLACLSAIEALCIICSGLTLNKVYKSFDFIGSAYLVMGSVYIIPGAIVLFVTGCVWRSIHKHRLAEIKSQQNIGRCEDISV